MQSPGRSTCRTNSESLHGPDCLALHPDRFGNIVPGVNVPVLDNYRRNQMPQPSLVVRYDSMLWQVWNQGSPETEQSKGGC
jgi:hypothetical protein